MRHYYWRCSVEWEATNRKRVKESEYKLLNWFYNSSVLRIGCRNGLIKQDELFTYWLVAYRKGGRGRFGGFKPPPPPAIFRRPSKIVTSSTRLWKLLKMAEFRTPTPQDIWKKKGSKILKLPPVRNCFTLATTNKLVVMNSLKVYKLKNKVTIWNEISCTNITVASRTPD